MRPIWKGILSFGLVNVPVSLVNATRAKNISFNQLRKSDYSRVKYKKVAHDGEEVAQSEIIKGYEISPDRYVVVSDSDMAAIAPKASRTIEISDFVKLNEIDPRYYDHSYYLVPDQGAGKAYALLLAAMKDSDVVGIARFVLRSKEYLAAIRPAENVITLSTMLFADEVISPTELETSLPSGIELSEREIGMAKTLIQALITTFHPEKYENEYHKQIMSMIESKAEGEAVTVAESAAPASAVIDIMAALEASMKAINESAPKRKAKKNKTA